MAKKKRPEYVKIECQKVLDRIEEELLKPESKLNAYDIETGNYKVPRKLLFEIREEIKKMIKILDKKKYLPSYIYPLSENYRNKTELSELLRRIWGIYNDYT